MFTNMKQLTKKEEIIMDLFWEHGPMHVRQLLEYYDEPKPHFNTVSTFVRGLEEKGFLAHEGTGKNYEYHPIIDEAEYRNGTLKNIVAKYFDNSFIGVVSTFIKEEDLSVDELQKLINSVEKANKK